MIHKLFKVLVPRYVDYTESFTSLYRLGPDYSVYLKYVPRFPLTRLPKELAVLELKGNPLPPIHRRVIHSEKWLTNVLLTSAKQDYETQ
ncbi:39S ribosomal protein L17-like protein [Leptotrombidium deliense]|uniref:39S ribosomal protein L17-like protein n=1 Tax=Leptotrombidium deliense TaxID=299467 RepID=A0A443SC50_9ACAR|nr:39S ribosomal protein L17-like protein [Leptotrombidium deliense]